MAIFDFRQVTQQSGESIDEFYRRLKEKSSLCGFHDEDNEIKTQIIHKTADSRLRRKALREQLSLKDIIKYGKTLEQSDVSARKLERIEKSEQSTNEARNEATNQNESKNRQHNHRGNRHINQQSSRQNTGNKSQQQRAQSCRNCGGTYPHPRGKTSCPASGKECSPKQSQNNRSTGSILITSLPKNIRYQNIRYQVILTMSSPLTFMINRNNHK